MVYRHHVEDRKRYRAHDAGFSVSQGNMGPCLSALLEHYWGTWADYNAQKYQR